MPGLSVRGLLLLVLVALASCSTLSPELDPPIVSLESFRSVPGEGEAPRFEIKLRVINPNARPLDIVGVSYQVSLMDRELIVGVSRDVPLIESYSEEVITINATLQLIELVKLFVALGKSQSEPITYKLSAKIDFAGLVPTQRLVESGEINLK